MQRSFKSRLEALEALEAPARVTIPVAPPPPAFTDLLDQFATVLAAIDAGKCSFWCGYFNSCAKTQEEHSLLCWPCQFVTRCMREWGDEPPQTLDGYTAWILSHRLSVAFVKSRYPAELDALVSADATDPLFWNAAERAVMDAWARLVEAQDEHDI
jgi:hypothetical protein